MLDLKFVRENIELVRKNISDRHNPVNMDEFVAIDAERRKFIAKAEELKAERNRVSAQIGELKAQGKDADSEIKRMQTAGEKIKELDEKVKESEEKLRQFILLIPNMPLPGVPYGESAEDNAEIRKWGTPPKFDFKPKTHWEIGEELGILDFKRGAKMSGSRFTLYWGISAKLERALVNFMLNLHTKEHGYLEVLPPFLINSTGMEGTGQLPRFRQELYKCADDDLFLIPTAESSLTTIHSREVLAEKNLPLKYVAHTPCFRREAGSYGKDVKGLMRQHQFNKVELYKFTKPEESIAELEKLAADAEKVLQLLELPYRVVKLCTDELGFWSAMTYDLEVWLPGENNYREISSCSNCMDYQARRADIKFKRKTGKTEYVHTLNGSGLAVGRTLIAILENFQEKDGTVTIPRVLRPYMDGIEKISGSK